MRKVYKNKRDYYKAEAERYAQNADFWHKEAQAKQEKINELNKPRKEKRIDVIWFCTQCRVVERGTIEFQMNIEDFHCLNCGAKKLLAVGKLKV